MTAAHAETANVLPLAAFPRCLPKTRVWGPGAEKQALIGASCWLSSSLRWGCGYIYGGTASGSTDQRFYASGYGRFNTVDPYNGSFNPASPVSFGRYTYSLGDPINHYDPSGLEACDDAVQHGAGGFRAKDEDGCGQSGGSFSGPDEDTSGGGGFDSGVSVSVGGGWGLPPLDSCALDPLDVACGFGGFLPLLDPSLAAAGAGGIGIGIGLEGGCLLTVICGAVEAGIAVGAVVTVGLVAVIYHPAPPVVAPRAPGRVEPAPIVPIIQSRRPYTAVASCSVHQDGTPDHASAGRVSGTGQGSDPKSAISAAFSDAQANVSAQYGVGFHAQHCSYQVSQ